MLVLIIITCLYADIFKFDPDFLENEDKYKEIKRGKYSLIILVLLQPSVFVQHFERRLASTIITAACQQKSCGSPKIFNLEYQTFYCEVQSFPTGFQKVLFLLSYTSIFDFFFVSAVFASQTFLVKVTQANHQMMMMTRMTMKMRMMMKTKAGFFFQNLFNAQSSLRRNGGHSIITGLVPFISNKMKYISFFSNRR